jgi:hypothetical protein
MPLALQETVSSANAWIISPLRSVAELSADDKQTRSQLLNCRPLEKYPLDSSLLGRPHQVSDLPDRVLTADGDIRLK